MKKIILINMLKGISHGFIIPLILFLFTSNILYSLEYLAFASIIYMLSKEKKTSRNAFFFCVGIYTAMLLLLAFMILPAFIF